MKIKTEIYNALPPKLADQFCQPVLKIWHRNPSSRKQQSIHFIAIGARYYDICHS